MKKRVLILGGGISGLSAAYFLGQRGFACTLLEKSERLGGWLHTQSHEGFLFERGPRTFQSRRAGALLELIGQLGLESECIFSALEAKKRYLWKGGKMHAIPQHPLKLFTSPLTRDLLLRLALEWRVAPSFTEESVWDFARRRLGQKAAERFFDPMVLGIYAGDLKRLSVRSCFPALKRWEEESGSLTRALFKASDKSGAGLFSLKGGTSSLVEALMERSGAEILLGEQVQRLRFSSDGVAVETQKGIWHGDRVVSTLPAYALAPLVGGEAGMLLESIEYASITVVNIGYKRAQLALAGFGYLIPTTEGEEVLGAVFDSSIFPQQNGSASEVRLTVMIRGVEKEDAEYRRLAKSALQRHLGLSQEPDVLVVTRATRAIPQYLLGHAEKIARLLQVCPSRCHLLGTYLEGVSVNDAILRAKQDGMCSAL